MKICILSTMYPRYKNDSRGLMIEEYGKKLLKEGIEVHVVAPSDENTKQYEVMDGIHVHRFNYFLPKFQRLAYGGGIPFNLRTSWMARLQIPSFAFFFFIKLFLVSRKCDIIHAQHTPPAFLAVMARPFLRKPIVFTERRVLNKGFMGLISKYTLKRVDYAIFNSSYTMNESFKIIKSKNASVVYNTLDVSKFKQKKVRKKNKVIFSMGLLVEKKGFEYLIMAMPKILEKNKDTKLIIAGEGQLEDKLKNLTKTLGIKDKVKFLGQIDSDKTGYYFNLCDVFVLPSIVDSKGETETLGVVLLEAMAYEKPVISSKVGGIADIVDEKSGILVKPKDVEGLARAVTNLLNNKSKAIKMGKEGRKKVLKEFTWTALRKKPLKIYNELLK